MEKQLSEGFHVTATSELKQFPIYPWTPTESLERKSKRLPYSFLSISVLQTQPKSSPLPLLPKNDSSHGIPTAITLILDLPPWDPQLGILFSCVTMPVSLHLAVFLLVPFTENLSRSAIRRTVFRYRFQLNFFSRLILFSNNMYVFRKSNCNHGNKNDGDLCCSQDSFLPTARAPSAET